MKNTGALKVTTPSDREITLTRVFDAPRKLVYDAFTKPELLKRWFGQRGWSLVVCDIDLKVGGGFRFVMRGRMGRTWECAASTASLCHPIAPSTWNLLTTFQGKHRLPQSS